MWTHQKNSGLGIGNSEFVKQFGEHFINLDFFSEAITEGDDIMAAVDERDKILKKYMNEWDELNLDLIITPASLMPAPLKVKNHI